ELKSVDFILYDKVFFFSSRRRHTRWPRDWSSDVCSSDLGDAAAGERHRRRGVEHEVDGELRLLLVLLDVVAIELGVGLPVDVAQIGRASCRERVEGGEGGGGGNDIVFCNISQGSDGICIS